MNYYSVMNVLQQVIEKQDWKHSQVDCKKGFFVIKNSKKRADHVKVSIYQIHLTSIATKI